MNLSRGNPKMEIRKLATFTFESEALWMILFPLAMGLLGLLVFLLAVLVRKFGS